MVSDLGDGALLVRVKVDADRLDLVSVGIDVLPIAVTHHHHVVDARPVNVGALQTLNARTTVVLTVVL
jgi:hypothetical protein